jgi:hypothetical protein
VRTQAAEERQRFAAPAHQVWAYRLDFTNLPEYNPDVSAVVRVAAGSGPGGDAGVGADYRFSLSTPGGPQPVRLTVTAAETGHRVDAEMEGGVAANESFVVLPDGDDASEAVLSLWVALPDGLDDVTRAAFLEHGRGQIRAELDQMARILDTRHT